MVILKTGNTVDFVIACKAYYDSSTSRKTVFTNSTLHTYFSYAQCGNFLVTLQRCGP